jgi:hypothetical protein
MSDEDIIRAQVAAWVRGGNASMARNLWRAAMLHGWRGGDGAWLVEAVGEDAARPFLLSVAEDRIAPSGEASWWVDTPPPDGWIGDLPVWRYQAAGGPGDVARDFIGDALDDAKRRGAIDGWRRVPGGGDETYVVLHDGVESIVAFDAFAMMRADAEEDEPSFRERVAAIVDLRAEAHRLYTRGMIERGRPPEGGE